MKFRKLRIAWSVVCGIACVLLVVLWVRSYWWCDMFEKRTASQLLQLDSRKGRLSFWQNNLGWPGQSPKVTQLLLYSMDKGRFYGHCPADAYQKPFWNQASILAFGRFGSELQRVIFIPYWFPVLISSALAAVPWIRWSKRFSLRTLLIATTLVAVVLGLIVWAVR
jgi:hypothetical protein